MKSSPARFLTTASLSSRGRPFATADSAALVDHTSWARTPSAGRTEGDVSPSSDTTADVMSGLSVAPLASGQAASLAVEHHYLHRRPPISFAYALLRGGLPVGMVTFGTPPSRHLQIGACPSDPSKVIELNRLWVSDSEGANVESWFVSRALKMLPPRIVVSYADTREGHYGYVYRALNFRYAGWTDMERKTPRYDYIPMDPTKHTREAFRSGVSVKVRRLPKVKYWLTTGNRAERKALAKLCGWPDLDWKTLPPPTLDSARAIAV